MNAAWAFITRWATWLGVRWRAGVVLMVFAFAATMLLGRAVQLQVTERDFYAEQGGDRQQRVQTIAAHRGMITDRHGEPLAISVAMHAIWIDPKVIGTHPEAVTRLADMLDQPAAELQRRVREYGSRRFLYVARQVRPSLAETVRAAKLPGVGLKREYKRFYPTADVTAPLLGFANIDDEGLAGIELSFDQLLAGTPGKRRILKDGDGREIVDLGVVQAARPGQDLALSIDRRLQYLAYRELSRAVEEHEALAGSATLMNVATGEVLAMASAPSFNPNNRASIDPSLTRNHAIVDQFEPGSTVKPFTVAAALASGRWQPADTVDTAPGYRRVGGFTIHDHRNYGTLDMTGLLEKSSNVGASMLAEDIGAQAIWSSYRGLGFGQVTGVGFPGEASGSLSLWRDWRVADTAAHSYGYGLAVTPLQLASAYVALANDGQFVVPSLLRRDGPPESRPVFDPDVADRVVGMLRSVVSPTGTAPEAAVTGFQIAGKTGTVRRLGEGGYSRTDYNTVFAGVAPASDPRLALVVVLHRPSAGRVYAGDVAAPVFQRVMSGALRMLNIRPDNLPELPAGQIAGDLPSVVADSTRTREAG
ncbi:penicillin-binding transpeptidase domain-containing protein [Guyparkeria halophila]|uniref:Peptidoglycan D,D-transpeptidase FtsI n=1 Tax=Guyparkeria halophila TaxID=47960 RepID=A0ABZ0YXM1_9GAMM|nr:penicillin-binding transpeptidase domain-containing protein [Guyparkeria halophila]WQH15971.1 penicillin-binding transpeptidase domain-containing protein [Guyparkeria halophila]